MNYRNEWNRNFGVEKYNSKNEKFSGSTVDLNQKRNKLKTILLRLSSMRNRMKKKMKSCRTVKNHQGHQHTYERGSWEEREKYRKDTGINNDWKIPKWNEKY